MRMLWWALGAVLMIASCDEETKRATGSGAVAAPASNASQASAGGSSQGGMGGAAGAGGQTGCQGLSDDGCYTCCGMVEPVGQADFAAAFAMCGCNGCQRPCATTLCGAGGMPDKDCAECAKSAIGVGGECSPFQTACPSDTPCGTFVDCFNACGP